MEQLGNVIIRSTNKEINQVQYICSLQLVCISMQVLQTSAWDNKAKIWKKI
jgi:hypothetical protein